MREICVTSSVVTYTSHETYVSFIHISEPKSAAPRAPSFVCFCYISQVVLNYMSLWLHGKCKSIYILRLRTSPTSGPSCATFAVSEYLLPTNLRKLLVRPPNYASVACAHLHYYLTNIDVNHTWLSRPRRIFDAYLPCYCLYLLSYDINLICTPTSTLI